MSFWDDYDKDKVGSGGLDAIEDGTFQAIVSKGEAKIGVCGPGSKHPGVDFLKVVLYCTGTSNLNHGKKFTVEVMVLEGDVKARRRLKDFMTRLGYPEVTMANLRGTLSDKESGPAGKVVEVWANTKEGKQWISLNSVVAAERGAVEDFDPGVATDQAPVVNLDDFPF